MTTYRSISGALCSVLRTPELTSTLCPSLKIDVESGQCGYLSLWRNMCKVSNSDNIRKLQNRCFYNLWCAFENMKEGTDFVPWQVLQGQVRAQISKSGTSIRKEGGLCKSGTTSFQSCFSPPCERILLEDWIQKICWNIILKTNLQAMDFAKKSPGQVCFSHVRNSLGKFVGRRAMWRSGENEVKNMHGQGRKEIWPKQGKEGTQRQLGCIME